MSVKLITMGIVDLTFNLTLTESEAENLDFKYNKIKTINDLEDYFFKKNKEDNLSNILNNDSPNINYKPTKLFNHITITSNNNYLNSLLFINRSNKEKTLIEFVMFNEMYFPIEKYFIKKIIEEITERNYIYLLQFKLKDDLPTKITLKIKIIEDPNDSKNSSKNSNMSTYDNEIFTKDFELFEKNCEVNCDLLKSQSFFFLFSVIEFKHDYFYVDFQALITFKKLKLDEIILFLELLITKYPNIKIIISFPDDLVGKNTDVNRLNFTKEIIEYADVLFIDSETMKKFYSVYFETFNKDWDKKKIPIISDRSKKRKQIPRTTVSIDMGKEVICINQNGPKLSLSEQTEMCLLIFNESESYADTYCDNVDFFKSVLIGSFLSRYLHEKSLNTCLTAANLTLKKMIKIIKYKMDTKLQLADYEVVVPLNKKVIELNEVNKQNEELKMKESKFVLDCVNKDKSKKPEYNPLLDEHCQRFFGTKSRRRHLRHLKLINRNDVVLKDPGMLFTRSPEETYKNIIGKNKRTVMKQFGDGLYKNQTHYKNSKEPTCNTSRNFTYTSTTSDIEYSNCYSSSGTSSAIGNRKYKFTPKNNILPKMKITNYGMFEDKNQNGGVRKNLYLKTNGFNSTLRSKDSCSSSSKLNGGKDINGKENNCEILKTSKI